ncbi:MAG: hypothetical protein QXL31_07595 [Thermosphaera sp.]
MPEPSSILASMDSEVIWNAASSPVTAIAFRSAVKSRASGNTILNMASHDFKMITG